MPASTPAPHAGGNRLLAWIAVAASVAYVAVAVGWAHQVTFYWDDYFLLLALEDRGLGGALLTGINGNWWPLATLGLQGQVALFGDWYPGYLGTNAALAVWSAWAGWFAFERLARRRPWLLAAALALYVGSLGMIVNVTVMTMSWPLAVALALTSAALAVRGRPAWAWASVLALAFLAESGLFAVLATIVAAAIVCKQMADRAWAAPTRRHLVLAAGLVAVGLAGTFVGTLIARRDPIDYLNVVSAVTGGDVTGVANDGGHFVARVLEEVAAFVPAWLVAPLLPPMLVRPAALPWLVIAVRAHLPLVLALATALGAVVLVLWRRRVRDEAGAERWGRLLAAGILAVAVVETAFVLAAVRAGSGLAPRYWILWLLPASVAWAVVLQARPPATWLRAGRAVASVALALSAAVCLVLLPVTFRAAFDIDLDRVANSADQVVQMANCRAGLPAVANQQVSPRLSDEHLCQVADFLTRG